MSSYDLNENNFELIAAKAYEKPNAMFSEFESDIMRVKYIKRLIRKYLKSGELKVRLILNHIIVLSNVFNVDFTVKLLFYKLEPEELAVVKAFLIFLKYMPERIEFINGKVIESDDIVMDEFVITEVRKFKQQMYE